MWYYKKTADSKRQIIPVLHQIGCFPFSVNWLKTSISYLFPGFTLIKTVYSLFCKVNMFQYETLNKIRKHKELVCMCCTYSWGALEVGENFIFVAWHRMCERRRLIWYAVKCSLCDSSSMGSSHQIWKDSFGFFERGRALEPARTFYLQCPARWRLLISSSQVIILWKLQFCT